MIQDSEDFWKPENREGTGSELDVLAHRVHPGFLYQLNEE
jgi:hypothetical protein